MPRTKKSKQTDNEPFSFSAPTVLTADTTGTSATQQKKSNKNAKSIKQTGNAKQSSTQSPVKSKKISNSKSKKQTTNDNEQEVEETNEQPPKPSQRRRSREVSPPREETEILTGKRRRQTIHLISENQQQSSSQSSTTSWTPKRKRGRKSTQAEVEETVEEEKEEETLPSAIKPLKQPKQKYGKKVNKPRQPLTASPTFPLSLETTEPYSQLSQTEETPAAAESESEVFESHPIHFLTAYEGPEPLPIVFQSKVYLWYVHFVDEKRREIAKPANFFSTESEVTLDELLLRHLIVAALDKDHFDTPIQYQHITMYPVRSRLDKNFIAQYEQLSQAHGKSLAHFIYRAVIHIDEKQRNRMVAELD